MRLFFNRRKAAQAAACLVQLHDGAINLMALIKLLYLADREVLLETGYTITGDKMVSMPHGLVLSRIYDSIKWGKTEGDPWYEYITERDSNEVSLLNPSPERDELSDYEVGVLERIHETYGPLDRFELRDLTHTLPEWTDPEGSSYPIDPAEILRLAGKSNTEIEQFTRMAEEMYFLAHLGKLAVSCRAGESCRYFSFEGGCCRTSYVGSGLLSRRYCRHVQLYYPAAQYCGPHLHYNARRVF